MVLLRSARKRWLRHTYVIYRAPDILEHVSEFDDSRRFKGFFRMKRCVSPIEEQ